LWEAVSADPRRSPDSSPLKNRRRTGRRHARPIRPGVSGCSEGLPHMARALVGYIGSNNDRILAMEVARLRRRVAELEAELVELRETSHVELDLELHRIAEAAEPALT
jgi:hypothetical protein